MDELGQHRVRLAPHDRDVLGSYTSIASGTDVDGNGSLDVVTRSVGGGATLHSISDSGRLTTVRTMGKPFVWYPTILATTDLDGDGRGDIRGVATGGRMRAWRSTGTTWSQLSGTTLGWDRYSVVASPGDVNGSSTGQADVIGWRVASCTRGGAAPTGAPPGRPPRAERLRDGPPLLTRRLGGGRAPQRGEQPRPSTLP